MPVVGRVTLVPAVVSSDNAFVAENVMTSPPPNVIELVPNVVVSDAVKVLPSAIVRVDDVVGAVIVTLFRDVTVVAPAPRVPVVLKFSFPKDIAPVESVIDPDESVSVFR